MINNEQVNVAKNTMLLTFKIYFVCIKAGEAREVIICSAKVFRLVTLENLNQHSLAATSAFNLEL